MEIKDFEILLIGVTFYIHKHVKKLVFNVLEENPEYNRDRRVLVVKWLRHRRPKSTSMPEIGIL